MPTETVKLNRWTGLLDLLDSLEKRENLFSWILAGLIILILILILILLPFPEYREVSEVEVDEEIFEIFEPKPVEVFRPGLPEKKVEAIGDLAAPTEEEIARIFDFRTFEEVAGGDDLIQEMDVFNDPGAMMDELLKDVASFTEGVGTMSDDIFLLGEDASSLADDIAGLKISGTGAGLPISDGSGLSSGQDGTGPGGMSGIGAGDGKGIGTGSGIGVTLKSFGEDDYRGNEIVDPLIEWMKNHPGIHEYTIRTFLEYHPNDICSIVRFSIYNRIFEMYLMVTEETRELSIFIVEGNRFTKLVDQGISKRSHRLETGFVERDVTDSRIVNIFSTQSSPAREKTDDFMSVFLTWWNDGNPAE